MKNLTIAIFLTILISLDSFGWSGKLISPQLGLSSDLSDSQIERVHSLINYMTNDLTFIEGSFINQFSSQRFGGTAEKVSCFLTQPSHRKVGNKGKEAGFFCLDLPRSRVYEKANKKTSPIEVHSVGADMQHYSESFGI